MPTLCGEADVDGPPLSWACCGSSIAAEDVEHESESKADIYKSDEIKTVNSTRKRYPPIVFSSADTKLTLTRSIARSMAESTLLLDDNEDDPLFLLIADLLGNSAFADDAADFGDRVVMGMGYRGGFRSIGHRNILFEPESKASEGSSASDATTASSSQSSPPTKDAGDNTSTSSSGLAPIPDWVEIGEKKETPKLPEIAEEKTGTKKKKSLRSFLLKRNKKSGAASPPSDNSTTTSALSSVGLCTALGEK